MSSILIIHSSFFNFITFHLVEYEIHHHHHCSFFLSYIKVVFYISLFPTDSIISAIFSVCRSRLSSSPVFFFFLVSSPLCSSPWTVNTLLLLLFYAPGVFFSFFQCLRRCSHFLFHSVLAYSLFVIFAAHGGICYILPNVHISNAFSTFECFFVHLRFSCTYFSTDMT